MKGFLPLLLFLPLSLYAQDPNTPARSYWSLTSVETGSGEPVSFLVKLQRDWRRTLEIEKKRGQVLSYRLFDNSDGRDGDPTLWLFVEHKSTGEDTELPYDYWQHSAEVLWNAVERQSGHGSGNSDRHSIRSEVLEGHPTFNR